MFKWKKACLITGLFYFLFFSAASQNRERVNELINQISSDNDQEELVILKEKTEKEVNPDLRLEYAELLIKKAAEDSLLNFLHSGYLQKGNALQLKGDYAKALEAFFQSLELAYKIGEPKGIGALMVSIADTYNMSGNSSTSQQYYKKAIGILRTTNDSVTLASGLLNAGDAAFTNKDYAKALEYFEESGLIFKEINYPLGIAYNLGNVGMVYAEQGKHELAKNNINESIAILEELKDYYPISVFLRYMADIYAKQNDLPTSFSYAERSLDLAISNGLKDQISESNLLLANLSSQAGNYEKAYNFFKDHITYRDSITNVQTVQQMAELRADSEVSQKQAEVDLLAQQKRTQNIIVLAIAVALFLLSLIALGLYRRNKFVNRTKRVIEKEKKRSDLLLRNILPEETAQELKEYGKVKSKRFESVTVLFTDFKDFTMYAETATPEELVESVDYYFSNFDDIIDKYGLEKIKTVGDAYMCAGGLPFPIRDHALNVVLAALEMVEFVSRAKQNVESNILKFDIRIGISSGPVVAGVVGKKKFVYDIWGDTVNIASRMESNCGTGRVNISENTFELIRDHCQCDYRGEIKAKNKGMMKMYYVSGIEIKKDESHIIQSPITA